MFAVTENQPSQEVTALQGLTTDDPDKFLRSASNLSQKLACSGFIYKNEH